MRQLLYLLPFFLSLQAFGQGCQPPSGVSLHDVNQFQMTTPGGGHFFGNPLGTSGLMARFNEGDFRSLVYSTGLWMGGIAPDQQLKLAGVTYSMGGDYFPGPLPNDMNTYSMPDCGIEFDRQYVVLRELAERQREYGYCLNNPDCDLVDLFPLGYEVPGSLLEYPGARPEWDAELAPFHDLNGDGYYTPLEGDFPLFASMPESSDCCRSLKGDLAVVWYGNDLAGVHTSSQGGQIGVDFEQMIYLFFSDNPAAPLYQRFRLVNRRTQTLTDFLLGLFIDADLGDPFDDLGGSDPDRNMVFFYNGDSFDGNNGSGPGWESNIPALGYTHLGDADGFVSNMEVAIFHDPTAGFPSLPNTPAAYYLWMDGHYQNGLEINDNPEPQAVQFQGYPIGNEGYQPSDQKVLMGFSVGDFMPGDDLCIEGAFLVNPNTSGQAPAQAVAELAGLRDEAFMQWDSCFACVPPVVRIFSEAVGEGMAFLNLSEADTYAWDFGDGNTSSERFPQHEYAASGTYTVSLTVTNDCGTASGSFQVDISTNILENSSENQDLKVFPNPAKEMLHIDPSELDLDEQTGLYQLFLSDMAGQVVIKKDKAQGPQSLDVRHLAPGVYLLLLSTEKGKRFRKRVVLQ